MGLKTFIIASLTYLASLAMAKTLSYTEFAESLKSLSKNKMKVSSVITEPVNPVRQGRVKIKVMKGTFQTQGENKWEYAWHTACENESPFDVFDQFNQIPSIVSVCNSTFKGRTIKLATHALAVEGDMALNPGEPFRKMIAYAVVTWPVTTDGNNPDADFAPLGSSSVAFETRVEGKIFITNASEAFIMCATSEVSKPITQPGPNKKFSPGENMVCTTPFTEVFRVTAELMD